jgi:hypothetical protein
LKIAFLETQQNLLKMVVKRILPVLFLVTLSVCGFAQKYMTMKPKNPIICYAKDADAHTLVEAPEQFQRWKKDQLARTKTATFEVTYVGFSEQAKAAFQEAVDIWSTLIESDVPIRVNATWQPLGQGVLGSAIWGSVHANFDGAQRVNTWYPAALAEKMAGVELNGDSEFDIYANFSSTFNWNYALSGTVPAGQYDLVTVVLHELGHGLGFVDSYSVSGSSGFVGVQGTGVPMIYDQMIENASEKNLFHDFVNGTEGMHQQLISEALFFNTPRVVATNGSRARIYAPNPYDAGSSIAHLDETTFQAGSVNSLMTPQVGAAESNHNPGSIVLEAFSDMGWVFTHIKHTDLKDSENLNGPYVVKAVITSDAGPISLPKLLYQSSTTALTSIDMVPTGQPNEYQASIPGSGNPSQYAYFITVLDGLNREYFRPGILITPNEDPEQFFTVFSTGPDTKAPSITHAPKAFILDTDGEYKIEAIVSDNIGLADVRVQYSINNVAQADILMTPGTPDSLYSATIDFGSGLNSGDILKYRIVAKDNSVAQNVSNNPTSGFHEVNVTGLSATQDFYENDFNSATSDFFGEGFSVTKPSGFSDGALHSIHPYTEGNGLPNNQVNFIYQLRIPVRVKAGDGVVKFDEIVLVEPGESGSVFGSEDFFDYVVVEGSKDGGATWIPVGNGYDSRDYNPWLVRWNSSMNANNSAGVGDPALYRQRTLNLLNKFAAGDEVVIRFRLFSDPFSAGWGWAIDNLKIQIDDTPPVILHDHVDYRVQGSNEIVLNMKITDLSGLENITVEAQVNSGTVQPVVIPVIEGNDDYSLNLDISTLSDDDVISYRIVALDVKGFEAVFPATGSIVVPALKQVTPLQSYANDFNSASSDFVGNFFSIAKPSGFADNAIHSEHSYRNGFGIDKTSSFSYILTKPIKINENNPYIRFDEIAIVQPQDNGVAFGTPAFNDYVVVEGSDDGGLTWKIFANGYDATKETSWSNAYSTGLLGSSTMFRRTVINLLDNGNFSPNDEVHIRFRLYADASSAGWGWTIDNLYIQDAVTGVDEAIATSDFTTSPNPAHDQLAIELRLPGSGIVEIGLYNVQGQPMIRQQGILTDGLMKTTMDVASLSDGFYLVKAQVGNRQVVRKVIKTSE